MDIDKDDIAEELDHHKKMLKELRRRLRERELQEVKHGINVPPEITSDIHDLTERIQRHESEITRLQTLAAEDKEPLGEVEYRALLAEAWDTVQYHPTVAGAARLEFNRLRLGIRPERAFEIESEIRIMLATEKLLILDSVDIWANIVMLSRDCDEMTIKKGDDEYELRRKESDNGPTMVMSVLVRLTDAMRFDMTTTVNWFCKEIVDQERLDMRFFDMTISNGDFSIRSQEMSLYEQFIEETRVKLAERKLRIRGKRPRRKYKIGEQANREQPKAPNLLG